MTQNTPDPDPVQAELAASFGIGLDEVATHPAASRITGLVEIMRREGAGRREPVRGLLATAGDKWSTLLLRLLDAGALRFSALRRLSSVIAEETLSERVLALKLKALERDGLVSRHDAGSVPPRVDYALTPLGRDFLAQTDALVMWVIGRSRDIRAARAAFDAGQARDG